MGRPLLLDMFCKAGGASGRFKWDAAGRRAVMGIDWMNRDELAQAIPPAYTRFIGEQLLSHLAVARG